MSDFFDSEIVRESIREINKLQEEVYGSILRFPSFDMEQKLEHVEKLRTLIEKQKIMFARVSLSNDPAAKAMKEQVRKSAEMLGFPSDVDISIIFDDLEKVLDSLVKNVDS